MWRYLRYLHAKYVTWPGFQFFYFLFLTLCRCLLTACPSNSTAQMLQGHGFDNTRIWPRGVDLNVFTPLRRSHTIRESWGVPTTEKDLGANLPDKFPTIVSSPSLPPPCRWPITGEISPSNDTVVILSVSRMYAIQGLPLLWITFLPVRLRRTLPF
jgi:hypothetical protein